MPLSRNQVKRVASLELNTFNLAPVMPELLEGARITSAGTPIFDIIGEVLFYRVPIKSGSRFAGYSDIGANEALGEPLLAVSSGMAWQPRKIMKEAKAAAKRIRRSIRFNKSRFVAYSYPKIAVQFLLGSEEVMMLELGSWAEVPKATAARREPLKPSNFERWSLLDEMPSRTKRANIRKFNKRVERWESPEVRRIDTSRVRLREFKRAFRLELERRPLVRSRELHYSPRDVDHHICYELRGQQTPVWCVAASVEMLLNFYRYEYDQPRLANELNLGTCNNPNGLPYSQVGLVVTVIENLTSNALDATMHTNPGWTVFRDQIDANRPLISFVPGHSRTVAGYVQWLIAPQGQTPFRGLLVYDPWPPTTCAVPDAGGTITRWENFAAQTYQFAYSVELQHI